jgi:hypothetical protein
MTLGNMRELGVRSLAVTCELCHHKAVFPGDRWPDAVLVRDFRPRMVYTVSQPNWQEMHAPREMTRSSAEPNRATPR